MTDEQPAPKKRHGTETRQRQMRSTIRWEMAEFNKVAAKANRAGLTFGAFMRAAVLREEKTLETRFGDSWRKYAARVPRWL